MFTDGQLAQCLAVNWTLQSGLFQALLDRRTKSQFAKFKWFNYYLFIHYIQAKYVLRTMTRTKGF